MEVKWPSTLGLHFEVSEGVGTRKESVEEIPCRGRFRVDKLEDLACLYAVVVVLWRGERKRERRDAVRAVDDSPGVDTAWFRVERKEEWKLRRRDVDLCALGDDGMA